LFKTFFQNTSAKRLSIHPSLENSLDGTSCVLPVGPTRVRGLIRYVFNQWVDRRIINNHLTPSPSTELLQGPHLLQTEGNEMRQTQEVTTSERIPTIKAPQEETCRSLSLCQRSYTRHDAATTCDSICTSNIYVWWSTTGTRRHALCGTSRHARIDSGKPCGGARGFRADT
jgi:hypothetical protein